jgi:hypothetical protein
MEMLRRGPTALLAAAIREHRRATIEAGNVAPGNRGPPHPARRRMNE